MTVPVDFRVLQIKAGITAENIDAFLDNETPRSKEQKDLIVALENLMKIFDAATTEEKKTMARVLLVYGAEGRGKSYLCSAALNQYLKNLYNKEVKRYTPDIENIIGEALYLTHFELDLLDKSCMNPKASRTQYEQYKRMTTASMVVIDEIGRGSWSDYSSQNIENIISKRYANMQPTVLITNKTAEEIVRMFDKSIRDRLTNGKTGVAINLDSDKSRSQR